jgi:hypothetical protein
MVVAGPFKELELADEHRFQPLAFRHLRFPYTGQRTATIVKCAVMPVRIILRSGDRRMVETADAARVSGPFFEVTQKYREGMIHTVLTLRADDVVGAEILKDGVVVDYVLGDAGPRAT